MNTLLHDNTALNDEFQIDAPAETREVVAHTNPLESPPDGMQSDLPSLFSDGKGLVEAIEDGDVDPNDYAVTSKQTVPESTNKWDPRFLLDLAIGIDGTEVVLNRYGIPHAEYDKLMNSTEFRRELALVIRDVKENGITFAAKARVQAEDYLKVLDELVYNQGTPASTRLEAIRSTVKWGRLEAEKGEGEGVNAQQININISF